MKRSVILSIVLSAVMLFSFAGCGSDSAEETTDAASVSALNEEMSVDTADEEALSAETEQEEAAGDAAETQQESNQDASDADVGTASESSAAVSSSGSSSSSGGSSSGSTSAATPAQSQAQTQAQTADPSKETAQSYIGKSLSSLTAAIGQPNSSDYASSCLDPDDEGAEDGELHYSGFTVYTFRDGSGNEKVVDVQ